jgi:hypothetical protein
VDDFEDQLLTTLSDDLTCEGSGVDGSSPVSIEERRLKVVLYNGWTLVGSPVIGYLDKVSPSAAGRTTGSFRGSTYGLRSNLILKVSGCHVHVHADISTVGMIKLVVYVC